VLRFADASTPATDRMDGFIEAQTMLTSAAKMSEADAWRMSELRDMCAGRGAQRVSTKGKRGSVRAPRRLDRGGDGRGW
jgi:hypothetical protein